MKISSYDIIGSKEKAVAIVEIPAELFEERMRIAKQIMERHKNVKSILRKISEIKGVFRTREYELLAGDENTEVIHRESGCVFKLDPQKVYFSVREGTERVRIAEQIKPGERVMVMFAGVGVYGIIITKKQPLAGEIISIEISPFAFEYMKENIRLNKVEGKVIPILGDVKEKCRDWYNGCDRVIMPLPHEAWKYIVDASKCLKDKGTIHMYLIEREEDVNEKVKKIMDELREKIKKNIFFKIQKVLPYAPRINKYRIDMILV